jgi:two-component system sensor histidine kinase PhoQ
VHISLAVRNRALEVVVADDGPGFADPEVALQRGVRVDERVPGHGIGLTVVADILTAYGGSIQLGRGAAGSRWPGAQVTMIWPKTV